LLALRSSPPSFTPAEGERLARELFGLAVTAAPLHGERDRNFHLRGADEDQFVLKLLSPEADAGAADCLVQVLCTLAEQDPSLPVPKLFPNLSGEPLSRIERDGRHYRVCLLSYLPGQLLGYVPKPPALLKQLGELLGRVDRALQGFYHGGFARELAWDMRALPSLAVHAPLIDSLSVREAVLSVAARLRALAPQLRGLRSQALHADCHGQNVLVSADGSKVCGIFDFGDVMYAPVVFEPAVAMAELMMEGASLREVEAILSGFAGIQSLAAADIEVLLDLVQARHACAVLLHAYRLKHDPKGAELLHGAATRTAESLRALCALDRAEVTRRWHDLSGTVAPEGAPAVTLPRRHALMGAGSELFYRKPLHLVRGEGVWLMDPSGNRYLDVYNNVPHVGHAHPRVVRAIQAQAAVLATHTRYLHGRILDYAEALTARLPAHLNTCIFVNSGSEANDVAWRIAKLMSGGNGALIMSNAYHGITDAIGALTPGGAEPSEPWVAALQAPSAAAVHDQPLTPEVLGDTDRDVASVIERLQARGFKPAAWFIDTGLTSSGVFDPPPAWAQRIARAVRGAGALVVADEVQYGLGRSGSHFFGFERRGLTPDLVTLGKPVGNGFPMGVIIANRDLIEAFQRKYGFFSTFGGNAVAAAAGLAVLNVLDEEQLMANAQHTGEYLRQGLLKLSLRHPQVLGAVRGQGLLFGVQVRGENGKTCAAQIINALAEQHRVLIGYEGPQGSILKLRPPMPFAPGHADLLLAAMDAVAASMADRS
jgi:4-aminobutyrate aminotransferase-like enzyme/Ser/Thr protein kinase RdoA (MazF antagonist)